MSNDHPDDPGHGDSVAAWTSVIVIMLAFAIGTWAAWVADSVLLYISIGIGVVGVVLGPILSKLGFGLKR